MKSLIVEDDFTSRLLLQKLLEPYGERHIAVNGKEAVLACRIARESGQPYDLVCLDIVMPEMDGRSALKAIRAEEKASGVLPGAGPKIVMTTALNDMENVKTAYRELCDGYLVKPINKRKLLELINEVNLVL